MTVLNLRLPVHENIKRHTIVGTRLGDRKRDGATNRTRRAWPDNLAILCDTVPSHVGFPATEDSKAGTVSGGCREADLGHVHDDASRYPGLQVLSLPRLESAS